MRPSRASAAHQRSIVGIHAARRPPSGHITSNALIGFPVHFR
jgi:hypothetical protein